MALAEESARAMLLYGDRPLALLGHSMGALIAFESVRLIAGQRTVLRLFASAARPPSRDWEVADVDACDDAMLVADLRRLGGVPEPLLEDNEIRDEVLRVLRADYRTLRGYQFRRGAVLPVPITAMLGDSDPRNTVADAGAWSRHTRAGFGVEVLPGGHFYLNDQLPAIASVVAQRIRQDLGDVATRLPGEESP